MPEGWEAPPWGRSVPYTDHADFLPSHSPPTPQPLRVGGTGGVCFLFFPSLEALKGEQLAGEGEWGEAETGWRKGEGRRVS